MRPRHDLINDSDKPNKAYSDHHPTPYYDEYSPEFFPVQTGRTPPYREHLVAFFAKRRSYRRYSDNKKKEYGKATGEQISHGLKFHSKARSYRINGSPSRSGKYFPQSQAVRRA